MKITRPLLKFHFQRTDGFKTPGLKWLARAKRYSSAEKQFASGELSMAVGELLLLLILFARVAFLFCKSFYKKDRGQIKPGTRPGQMGGRKALSRIIKITSSSLLEKACSLPSTVHGNYLSYLGQATTDTPRGTVIGRTRKGKGRKKKGQRLLFPSLQVTLWALPLLLILGGKNDFFKLSCPSQNKRDSSFSQWYRLAIRSGTSYKIGARGELPIGLPPGPLTLLLKWLEGTLKEERQMSERSRILSSFSRVPSALG